jgi:hypothetical protein
MALKREKKGVIKHWYGIDPCEVLEDDDIPTLIEARKDSAAEDVFEYILLDEAW